MFKKECNILTSKVNEVRRTIKHIQHVLHGSSVVSGLGTDDSVDLGSPIKAGVDKSGDYLGKLGNNSQVNNNGQSGNGNANGANSQLNSVQPNGLGQNKGNVQPQNGGLNQQPGGNTQKPGGTTQQPGGINQQPAANTQQPGANTQQPGANIQQQPQQQPGGTLNPNTQAQNRVSAK